MMFLGGMILLVVAAMLVSRSALFRGVTGAVRLPPLFAITSR